DLEDDYGSGGGPAGPPGQEPGFAKEFGQLAEHLEEGGVGGFLGGGQPVGEGEFAVVEVGVGRLRHQRLRLGGPRWELCGLSMPWGAAGAVWVRTVPIPPPCRRTSRRAAWVGHCHSFSTQARPASPIDLAWESSVNRSIRRSARASTSRPPTT